jgi:hypothetical protein
MNDDKTQMTPEQGHEIPIPKKTEFFNNLGKVAPNVEPEPIKKPADTRDQRAAQDEKS